MFAAFKFFHHFRHRILHDLTNITRISDVYDGHTITSLKRRYERDYFNFEKVNFPFLDGDVPRSPSYGVYISQLIRFARVCSNVSDFNNRNLF